MFVFLSIPSITITVLERGKNLLLLRKKDAVAFHITLPSLNAIFQSILASPLYTYIGI